MPILLLVLTGAVLVGTGFIGHDFRRGMERFLYWVALPCLLVVELGRAPSVAGEALPMVVAVIAGTLAATAVAIAVALVGRWPGAVSGSFVQAAVRGNIAFVGLPVVVLASHGDETIRAKAALVLAPLVVAFNLIAVPALIVPQHKLSWSLPVRVLRSVVTNPLIIACGVGMLLPLTPGGVVAWVPRTVIDSVGRSLALLGGTAAPLALVCLGGAVLAYRVGPYLGKALAASTVKLVVTPGVALLVGWALGLTADDLRTVLVFAATPTAVASYVLTSQLKGDVGLSAASIVVSTVLSFASLAAVLVLTG